VTVPAPAPTVGDLRLRIDRRDYRVGVVGLGYVGLPLALRFAEVGFGVLGFDLDADRVKSLGEGVSYLAHLPSERLRAESGAGRFGATTDLERLGEPDAVLICVPTPLTRYREPDLRHVETSADAIARTLRPGQFVCLESTTYPGTTDEVLLPRLEAGGLRVGQDFFLAYSSEREDPGNPRYSTASIPKVVGGITPGCLQVASALYATAVEQVVAVSSTRVAEASKILENVYRAVNVALVNELKLAFDAMGIDIWEVIDAARTKPFGFQPFYPGPGLGGHCVPIDPFYLTWRARGFGVVTRFIELAGEINSAMPAHVVRKLVEALNERGRALKHTRVLVVGVAYKPDTGDVRESPALRILELLVAAGADVAYADPLVPRLGGVPGVPDLASRPLTPDELQAAHAVVLVTDHHELPYRLLHAEAPLIVDTRNALRRRGFTGPHVVLA
jgi:UDP-N-acetyl-D-glucosamine dehydrogenase